MSATKPTSDPTWATNATDVSGNPLKVQPPIGKTALGFNPFERPSNGFLNWLLNTIAAWCAYLRDFELVAHIWQGTLGGASRIKLWTFTNGTTTSLARVFITSTGVLELTNGCDWDQANNRWQADAGVLIVIGRASASRVRLVGGVIEVEIPLTAGPTYWSDSAWESCRILGGVMSWSNVQSDAVGSNPPASTPLTNQLCAKIVPKQFGLITITSGTVALVDGANMGALTAPGTTTIRVPFVSPMDNVHYTVIASIGDGFAIGGGTQYYPQCHQSDKTTGYYDLHFVSAAGATLDLSAVTASINVLVLGVQTS